MVAPVAGSPSGSPAAGSLFVEAHGSSTALRSVAVAQEGVDLAPNLIPEGETFEEYLARRTSGVASRQKLEYGRPGWDPKKDRGPDFAPADADAEAASIPSAVTPTGRNVQYGRPAYDPKARRAALESSYSALPATSSTASSPYATAVAAPVETTRKAIQYGRPGYTPSSRASSSPPDAVRAPLAALSSPGRTITHGRPGLDAKKKRDGLESSYSALPAVSGTAVVAVPVPFSRPTISYGREGGYDPRVRGRAASAPPWRGIQGRKLRLTQSQGKLLRVTAKAVAFVATQSSLRAAPASPASSGTRKIDYKVGAGYQPTMTSSSSSAPASSSTPVPERRKIDYGRPGYERRPVPARSYAAPSSMPPAAASGTGKIQYGRSGGYTPSPRAVPAPSSKIEYRVGAGYQPTGTISSARDPLMYATAAAPAADVAATPAAPVRSAPAYKVGAGYQPARRPSSARDVIMQAAGAPAVAAFVAASPSRTRKIEYGRPAYNPRTR